MSHLSSKCDCGRTIHFPKDAEIGYKWVCKDCGKIWTLSTHGKPAYDTRSKKPPQQEYHSPPSSSGNSGVGCIFVGLILFSAFVGGTYKLIEFILA